MARISMAVFWFVLIFAFWYGLHVEAIKISRKTSISKLRITVNKLVARKLRILTSRMKPPSFITAVSKKVCARTFTSTEQKSVSALKKSLDTKTKSLTCAKLPTRFHPKTDDLLERARRSPGGCNPNSMDVDEKDARTDLAPMGININNICLKKYSCANRGSTDSATGTINMCHSCKYIVHLPAGYYPRLFLHFKCGDGDDLACLCSEGVCIKRQLNYQISNTDDGSDGQITVTTGCACEILQNSIFTIFV